MTKYLNILGKIGFNDKEIELYVYLLENGPSSISKISRGLNIHRPTIYKTISKLNEKGILSLLTKSQRKLYMAEPPHKIKDLINDISISVDSILPKLEDLYIEREQKPEIKFLEGRKAVTFVFSDLINSLKKGETFYRYTSEKDLEKVNGYLPKEYRKIRDEKKIERLVISNPVSGAHKKPRLERFIKYIPAELDVFQQNIIQLVYGDKVAFIDLNSETSLIIKNKPLAEFQKTIFKALYRKLN